MTQPNSDTNNQNGNEPQNNNQGDVNDAANRMRKQVNNSSQSGDNDNQPTPDEIEAQKSQLYYLWYKKTDGMSKEDQEKYYSLLAATNPNLPVEEKFKIADKLWEDEKPDDNNADAGDNPDQGNADMNNQGNNQPTNDNNNQGEPSNPRVAGTREPSSTQTDVNLAGDDNPAPLGTRDDYFKALEKRFYGQSRVKPKSN